MLLTSSIKIPEGEMMRKNPTTSWGQAKKVDIKFALKRGIGRAIMLLSSVKDQPESTVLTQLMQALAEGQDLMQGNPNVRDVPLTRFVVSSSARSRLADILGVTSVGDFWKVPDVWQLRIQLRRLNVRNVRDVLVAMHPSSTYFLKPRKKK